MTIAGRHALSAAAVLLALIGLTLAARPAAAAPIGSDGLVHACYKAKGKPKGALRVVKPGKPCKAKKEKSIAWSIVGTPGAGGSQGGTGTAGTNAASQDDVLALLGLIQGQSAVIDTLTGQLGALGVDVDGLTTQLGSLTGDVAGLEGTLAGVTNGDLLSAIDGVPSVTALCTQVSTVTTQVNALRTVIGGLGLNGVLTALGGVLQIPALPAALDPFSCPAP